MVRDRASKSKNSGQRAFSVTLPSFLTSNIAGNSTTSYWSAASFRLMSFRTRPVKSSKCQRVWIIATLPPGIKRVRAPYVNHSYALSNTSKFPLMMSCSLCGSSTSKRSAPRPANAEPTPQAKYSPPTFVFHRPADLLSAARVTVGKIFLYVSVSIKFLTFLPKSTAKSVVWETIRTFLLGCRPINHAGK